MDAITHSSSSHEDDAEAAGSGGADTPAPQQPEGGGGWAWFAKARAPRAAREAGRSGGGRSGGSGRRSTGPGSDAPARPEDADRPDDEDERYAPEPEFPRAPDYPPDGFGSGYAPDYRDEPGYRPGYEAGYEEDPRDRGYRPGPGYGGRGRWDDEPPQEREERYEEYGRPPGEGGGPRSGPPRDRRGGGVAGWSRPDGGAPAGWFGGGAGAGHPDRPRGGSGLPRRSPSPWERRGYRSDYGPRGEPGPRYGDPGRRYGGRGYDDPGRRYGEPDRGYGEPEWDYRERDRGYRERERGYDERDRGYGERGRGYDERERGYGERDRGYDERGRPYEERDRGYGGRERGYGEPEYGEPRQGYGEPEPEQADPTGTSSFGPDEEASPDAILIRRTMRIIEPIADRVTAYFYALLFLRHPHLRDLFPVAMDTQRDRLFRALLSAAKHADDTETLSAYLADLGRGHRKYGTSLEHYPAVGECLIAALTRYASEVWNEEMEAAWVRAYTAISQIMIDAAAEDEHTSPPWWHAEIVSHERRTSEVAVITVRPDKPYPFLAGQYASMETPWWPRVWRHYSFACAPRSDGLLTFHVKAVPAGWVSSAIVNRARPGDIVRLGPPAGSMTVNHETDNGLLCLGGGTGIAPIKALVEDVAEHGRRRPVDVFYAARSSQDLYDLDTMQRMERRHPWLSVRPVVSDVRTESSGLESGQLPEIVTRYGPWATYDAYLSGPPGMIRSSMSALVGIGMPTHRIRHDAFEDFIPVRG